MSSNPGSVHIEIEPTLLSRKCQEDLYDLAQYASRNEKSYFILTLPSDHPDIRLGYASTGHWRPVAPAL